MTELKWTRCEVEAFGRTKRVSGLVDGCTALLELHVSIHTLYYEDVMRDED